MKKTRTRMQKLARAKFLFQRALLDRSLSSRERDRMILCGQALMYGAKKAMAMRVNGRAGPPPPIYEPRWARVTIPFEIHTPTIFGE